MLLQLLEEEPRTDVRGIGGVGAKRLDGTGHADGAGCHACHELGEGIPNGAGEGQGHGTGEDEVL
jgi:hypothetical protein